MRPFMHIILQQLQFIVRVSSSDNVHKPQSGTVHLPVLLQDMGTVLQTYKQTNCSIKVQKNDKIYSSQGTCQYPSLDPQQLLL